MNSLQILAAQQLDKHGKDRYPTLARQAMKLSSEVGELFDAMLKADKQLIKAELADVALSLATLATKLGYDLDEVVRELVDQDGRVFTE